jgi:hypothetical protein
VCPYLVQPRFAKPRRGSIHYDRQRVFVMKFLTHAEDDKDTWKDDL